MPRNHKPSKVSQAINRRSGEDKYSVKGNGHLCPKSPTGAHWWRIASPSDKISGGVCQYCDEQRQFANTLEAAFSMGVK